MAGGSRTRGDELPPSVGVGGDAGVEASATAFNLSLPGLWAGEGDPRESAAGTAMYMTPPWVVAAAVFGAGEMLRLLSAPPLLPPPPPPLPKTAGGANCCCCCGDSVVTPRGSDDRRLPVKYSPGRPAEMLMLLSSPPPLPLRLSFVVLLWRLKLLPRDSRRAAAPRLMLLVWPLARPAAPKGFRERAVRSSTLKAAGTVSGGGTGGSRGLGARLTKREETGGWAADVFEFGYPAAVYPLRAPGLRPAGAVLVRAAAPPAPAPCGCCGCRCPAVVAIRNGAAAVAVVMGITDGGGAAAVVAVAAVELLSLDRSTAGSRSACSLPTLGCDGSEARRGGRPGPPNVALGAVSTEGSVERLLTWLCEPPPEEMPDLDLDLLTRALLRLRLATESSTVGRSVGGVAVALRPAAAVGPAATATEATPAGRCGGRTRGVGIVVGVAAAVAVEVAAPGVPGVVVPLSGIAGELSMCCCCCWRFFRALCDCGEAALAGMAVACRLAGFVGVACPGREPMGGDRDRGGEGEARLPENWKAGEGPAPLAPAVLLGPRGGAG